MMRENMFLLRDWCRGAGMILFNWPSRGVKIVKLRPDSFKEPIMREDVEVKAVYCTIAELRCNIGRQDARRLEPLAAQNFQVFVVDDAIAVKVC
jgi:hypothetical protein